MIQRLLGVRRHLEKNPESRDEVSRTILNALALKRPMNVSQMTREVERGSVSRVTLRKRVRSLMEEGVLERGEGFEYRLGVNPADY
jgi:DNA-binding HxlR family transcriptional regulator